MRSKIESGVYNCKMDESLIRVIAFDTQMRAILNSVCYKCYNMHQLGSECSLHDACDDACDEHDALSQTDSSVSETEHVNIDLNQ